MGALCSRLLQPSSRCTTPALSAAALASLGGSSSRRGSGDAGSIVMDAEASISELRVIMLFICIAQTVIQIADIFLETIWIYLPLNIFWLSIEHHTFLFNASDLRESTCSFHSFICVCYCFRFFPLYVWMPSGSSLFFVFVWMYNQRSPLWPSVNANLSHDSFLHLNRTSMI